MAGIFIMFAVAAVIVLLQTSVRANRAAARLAFFKSIPPTFHST